MRPLYRLRKRSSGYDAPLGWAISVAIAALAVLILLLILPEDMESWPVLTVAAWDAAVVPLLLSPWRIFLRSDSKATKQRAVEEDPGRKAVVVIPVLSSMVALVAAAGLIGQSEKLAWPYLWLVVLLGVLAVASAWTLVHTTFALHYARLYYTDLDVGEPRGLNFPSSQKPDDFDFAYFAFMIGTAFQGSDVDVRSGSMRQVVLAHAVLSFVFNTVILALVINVVFDVVR